MRIVYKKPGEPAEARNVPNELEEWQKLVGGYIETVYLTRDLIMIANEEGLLLELAPNFKYHGQMIVGPVVFVGVKDDEFIDIDRDWERKIIEYYREV